MLFLYFIFFEEANLEGRGTILSKPTQEGEGEVHVIVIQNLRLHTDKKRLWGLGFKRKNITKICFHATVLRQCSMPLIIYLKTFLILS